jgi:cytochrome c553
VTKPGWLIVAVALICPLAQSRAATFGTPGSQTAAACASCHLPDGHGSGIPPIAGLTESRIVQRMFSYRASEPGSQPDAGSQIMYVVANALSPQQITDVAHYIAEQSPAVKQP